MFFKVGLRRVHTHSGLQHIKSKCLNGAFNASLIKNLPSDCSYSLNAIGCSNRTHCTCYSFKRDEIRASWCQRFGGAGVQHNWKFWGITFHNKNMSGINCCWSIKGTWALSKIVYQFSHLSTFAFTNCISFCICSSRWDSFGSNRIMLQQWSVRTSVFAKNNLILSSKLIDWGAIGDKLVSACLEFVLLSWTLLFGWPSLWPIAVGNRLSLYLQISLDQCGFFLKPPMVFRRFRRRFPCQQRDMICSCWWSFCLSSVWTVA